MAHLKLVASTNATKKQNTLKGRYDGKRDARLPREGLARPAPSVHIRTAVGAVQDPERRDSRVQVTIAQDLLETELSRGRISEPAYGMGRTLQAVLEKGSGAKLGSASNIEGGRGSPIESQILRMAHGVVDARMIDATKAKVIKLIGTIGAKYVAGFLVGGWTYKSYLEDCGRRVTDTSKKDVAQRFRDLLEDLAAAWPN